MSCCVAKPAPGSSRQKKTFQQAAEQFLKDDVAALPVRPTFGERSVILKVLEPDSKAQPPIVHSHWPLSDPTPAVQLARRERLKMPQSGHAPTLAKLALLGGKEAFRPGCP